LTNAPCIGPLNNGLGAKGRTNNWEQRQYKKQVYPIPKAILVIQLSPILSNHGKTG
jgi:hypothetical protein